MGSARTSVAYWRELLFDKVTNCATWRQAFPEDLGTRQANGARGGRFYRNDTDPNKGWVLLERDDLFRARLFVKSNDLGEAIDRAGVGDQPTYWFLEDSERP